MNGPYRLDLRSMDTGEILDNAFQLYRATFADLFIIGLIAALPGILSTGISGPVTPAGRAATLALLGPRLATTGVFSLVSALLLPLVEGATVALVAKHALGDQMDWRGALTAAGRCYGRLLGVGVIQAVGAVIAAVVLAIAGLGIFSVITVPAGLIALVVYVGFSNHAVVIEDEPNSGSAILRSFRLVNGRFWPLLGLMIVLILLVIVVSGAAGYLVGLPFRFIGAGAGATTTWIRAILTGVASALTWPVVLIGRTLAYFDTRIRKEGFDLEMLARSQFGNGQPQP